MAASVLTGRSTNIRMITKTATEEAVIGEADSDSGSNDADDATPT
jgi:hypothetical protein